MTIEIKWCAADKLDPTRFWGYLIDKTPSDDTWYNPYYAFWGNIKSDGIQFKKISEHSMRKNFSKNVKLKRMIYEVKLDMDDKIQLEWEQQRIIRKLKQGG